ncbi:hypothetical protein EXIGLDRAFT_769952 [Exidia glandulosa HHB12029]|uniref:Uncharacterized protein n=1 Tax=Exidia glandulosa HHB12029 TaxID=1314781 RepID=A0A165H3X9_EXIGL|nr:hypothetical protein EXIGLDRAFT_769952 [Exidia glandulosa HHB12029]
MSCLHLVIIFCSSTSFTDLTFYGIALTQVVLILRTWAIWGRSRWVLVAMLTLFLALWIAETILLNAFIRETTGKQPLMITELDGPCKVVYLSNLVVRADGEQPMWALISSFDFVILVLTLIKALEQRRYYRLSNLITTLYHDGIIYFISVFFISLGYLIISLAVDTGFDVPAIAQLQFFLYAVLACRVMLHLRAAATQPRDQCSTAQMSGVIAFQRPYEGETELEIDQQAPAAAADETESWFGRELGDRASTSFILVIGHDHV